MFDARFFRQGGNTTVRECVSSADYRMRNENLKNPQIEKHNSLTVVFPPLLIIQTEKLLNRIEHASFINRFLRLGFGI